MQASARVREHRKAVEFLRPGSSLAAKTRSASHRCCIAGSMLAGWDRSSIVLREYRSELTCYNRRAGEVLRRADFRRVWGSPPIKAPPMVYS